MFAIEFVALESIAIEVGCPGSAKKESHLALLFQKDSALAQWCHARTVDGRDSTRKTMIVALARKLLIALWRR